MVTCNESIPVIIGILVLLIIVIIVIAVIPTVSVGAVITPPPVVEIPSGCTTYTLSKEAQAAAINKINTNLAAGDPFKVETTYTALSGRNIAVTITGDQLQIDPISFNVTDAYACLSNSIVVIMADVIFSISNFAVNQSGGGKLEILPPLELKELLVKDSVTFTFLNFPNQLVSVTFTSPMLGGIVATPPPPVPDLPLTVTQPVTEYSDYAKLYLADTEGDFVGGRLNSRVTNAISDYILEAAVSQTVDSGLGAGFSTSTGVGAGVDPTLLNSPLPPAINSQLTNFLFTQLNAVFASPAFRNLQFQVGGDLAKPPPLSTLNDIHLEGVITVGGPESHCGATLPSFCITYIPLVGCLLRSPSRCLCYYSYYASVNGIRGLGNLVLTPNSINLGNISWNGIIASIPVTIVAFTDTTRMIIYGLATVEGCTRIFTPTIGIGIPVVGTPSIKISGILSGIFSVSYVGSTPVYTTVFLINSFIINGVAISLMVGNWVNFPIPIEPFPTIQNAINSIAGPLETMGAAAIGPLLKKPFQGVLTGLSSQLAIPLPIGPPPVTVLSGDWKIQGSNTITRLTAGTYGGIGSYLPPSTNGPFYYAQDADGTFMFKFNNDPILYILSLYIDNNILTFLNANQVWTRNPPIPLPSPPFPIISAPQYGNNTNLYGIINTQVVRKLTPFITPPWSPIPGSQAVKSITFDGFGTIYGVGMNGLGYYAQIRTFPFTWQPLPGGGSNLLSIAIRPGDYHTGFRNFTLYGVTNNNVLYYKPFTVSDPWQLVGPTPNIINIAFHPSGVLFGVSTDNLIYRKVTDDTVSSPWEIAPLGGGGAVVGITFGPDGTLYGVNGGGLVYRKITRDVNSGWVQVDSGAPTAYISFGPPISAISMYGVGSDNSIYKADTLPVTTSWSPVYSLLQNMPPVTSVTFDSSSYLYASATPPPPGSRNIWTAGPFPPQDVIVAHPITGDNGIVIGNNAFITYIAISPIQTAGQLTITGIGTTPNIGGGPPTFVGLYINQGIGTQTTGFSFTGWRLVDQSLPLIAITYDPSGRLFGVASNNAIRVKLSLDFNSIWLFVVPQLPVVSIAFDNGGMLYGLQSSGQLYRRTAEFGSNWSLIGTPALPGGVRLIALGFNPG